MSINTMPISAGQALNTLKESWGLHKRGIRMSYMMHGRPGIGKTQVAETLARHIGGKLYDLRLTTIEPSDLRGMPHYDHDNRRTVWYRPEDLPDNDEPAVLFFDELTAASPFLQPTVYGILQERRVGQHTIPDNTIIIAAGNTVDDGAVAYEMGTAISDRLVHLSLQADPKDWVKNYAVPKGLHPAVTAFIETRPDYLETTEDAMRQQHMISATPRSWERVSQVMYNVTDRATRDIMVSGIVGQHVAAEFAIVADDISATVKVTEMLKAPRKDRVGMYPTKMHGLNALVFGLLGLLSKENMSQSIEIMTDLGRLADLRPDEPDLKLIPLRELRTNGFEALIDKYIGMGLAEEILADPCYAEYTKERDEMGLNAAGSL